MQFTEFAFWPHVCPAPGRLDILFLLTPEMVQPRVCPHPTARDECDFTFKPDFLGVALVRVASCLVSSVRGCI